MGLQRNPGLLLTGLCVGLLFSWMNLAQPTDLSGILSLSSEGDLGYWESCQWWVERASSSLLLGTWTPFCTLNRVPGMWVTSLLYRRLASLQHWLTTPICVRLHGMPKAATTLVFSVLASLILPRKPTVATCRLLGVPAVPWMNLRPCTK